MRGELLQELEEGLKKAVSQKDTFDKDLFDSMEYSLLAGGKRIRPMLLLLTGLSLGAKKEQLMPFAMALEMVHTYSLIHDDLPAMDNDDYRRGRLTNHKVFGEAKAILAGDGLLTLAFETMGGAMKTSCQALLGEATVNMQSGENLISYETLARQALAMEYLASSCGCKGMIAGQIADLNSEGRDIDLPELTYIESQKTSRLLMAAMMMGGLLAGASLEVLERLEEGGRKIGLAFQIQDDILDEEGTLESLGKMPGSDEKQKKATFVSLYGLDKAKERAKALTEEALEDLAVLPSKEGEEVRALVKGLIGRKG